MTRFVRGAALPVPPIVGQRFQQLPDGSIDPASLTDCGEACCSAILVVATGYEIGAGCIRQAMRLPTGDGRTTPDIIARFLNALKLVTSTYKYGELAIWDALGRSRHHGRYHMLLGNWVFVDTLHWVLAYEREGAAVRVMDPWSAQVRTLSQDQVYALSTGDILTVDFWSW